MMFWNDFLSLFYPECCAGCDEILLKGELTICTRCLIELPRTKIGDQDNPVTIKLSGRLPIDHGMAFLTFRKHGIVQRLMHEIKYRNRPDIAVSLGRAFGKEVSLQYPSVFDGIIPVPLHPRKQRERGYNQSFEFARGLGEVLQIWYSDSILCRTQHTKTQTRKQRVERWKSMSGGFRLSQPDAVRDKRILLVDDIITTGATLEACGQALLAGGCKALSVACIANTL